MKVLISEHIINLYQSNNLDIEVSLDWILGYIREENMNQLNWEKIVLNADRYVEIVIDEATIKKIKFKEHKDLCKKINLLLLNAFLLGGSE